MAPKRFDRVCLLLVTAAVFKVAQGEACVHTCDRGTKCVTPHIRCDNFPDCDDLSDEDNCKADGCDGLACSDGKCIQNNQHCDGHIDCADQTDEIGCTKNNYRLNHPSLTDEELCMRPCKSGTCTFLENLESGCICPYGYTGAFCEKNIFHELSKKPEVIVYTHNASENEIMSRHKTFEDDKFTCEPSQGYINSPLLCNGRVECEDRKDESNCTRNDYKRSRSDLKETNLCVMPCHHGVCKFDLKDVAYCKCKVNFEGLFCEIQNAPKIEATTDLQFSSDRVESTTSDYRLKTVVPAIESVPRADNPDIHQKGLMPPVNAGDAIRPKSEINDVLPEKEAAGSGLMTVMVTPLVVVAAVGVLLWTLVIKPCQKQQYDNAV